MLQAASLSPDEKQKQDAFKKAYGSQSTDDRAKAYALLEGAKHPTSWQLIATAVDAEMDDATKAEGLTILSKEPARDQTLARMLVARFQSVKPTNLEMRQTGLAKRWRISEFGKYDILNLLADVGSRMRYPDMPTMIHSGGMSVVNPEAIHRTRLQFEAFMKVFNAISGADITLTRDTPQKLPKWWGDNSMKFAKADHDLAEKYRAEDAAAAKPAKATP